MSNTYTEKERQQKVANVLDCVVPSVVFWLPCHHLSELCGGILPLSEAVTLRQLLTWPEQRTWRPSEAAQMGEEGFRALICQHKNHVTSKKKVIL